MLHGQGIQWKDKERRKMRDCMDIGQGIQWKYKERRRMRDCMDRVYNGRMRDCMDRV